MPTYEYLCKNCGHTFEELQSMSEDPLTRCPNCNTDNLARVMGTGGGFILKGSGFYTTDYRKSGPSVAGESAKKESDKKETATSGGAGKEGEAKEPGKKEAGGKKDAEGKKEAPKTGDGKEGSGPSSPPPKSD